MGETDNIVKQALAVYAHKMLTQHQPIPAAIGAILNFCGENGIETTEDQVADAVRGVYFPRQIPAHLLTRCTEAGDAELFAHLNMGTLKYDHRRGRWLSWDAHWWREDKNGEVQRRALNATRQRYHAAAEIKDPDIKKGVVKWAISGESQRRRVAMLAFAKNTYSLADPGDDWDQEPWSLGVRNGVVDLETGELQDGKQEDRITQFIPIDFKPEARCPRWGKFLLDVFAHDGEMIDFIHRAVGYSLTGSTREDVFFFLHGGGANGKSVFLETLREVLGPYAHTTPFSTFEAGWGGAGHSTELAELAGKRFVIANEGDEAGRFNAARLKQLAGGDTRTARFLYERSFSWKPTEKIWLASNYKPYVRDTTDGFWRKIALIPFEQQFRGKKADKNLKSKLLEEAPGILAWAVEGTLLWLDDGLPTPDKVRLASEEYREESDPLGNFLGEACETGPELNVKAGKLFQEYKRWAEEAGLSPRETLGSRRFGQLIGTRFQKEKRKDGLHYLGVGIHAKNEDAPL